MADIQELERQLAQRDAEVQSQREFIREQAAEIDTLRRQLGEQQAKIELILQSRSWRLTAPLRALRKDQ